MSRYDVELLIVELLWLIQTLMLGLLSLLACGNTSHILHLDHIRHVYMVDLVARGAVNGHFVDFSLSI